MNIKNIIYIAVFLVSITSSAQRKPSHEKIKALKIAYLTEQLNLTPKEAQNFWPIYNSHEEKVDIIRKQKRTDIFEKTKNIDALSEAEATKLLELEASLDEKRHALEKKYINDVRKVISSKKTFILLQSENGFKRKLIKEYRQKQKSEK